MLPDAGWLLEPSGLGAEICGINCKNLPVSLDWCMLLSTRLLCGLGAVFLCLAGINF